MNTRDHERRRATRAWRAAVAGLLLLAGLCVGGTGTAYAASGIIPVASDKFVLSRQADYSTAVDKTLTGSRVGDTLLHGLTGGRSGKAGLCYPTPFNPGVDADGYCWGEPTDADESGTNGWAPQGFSVPHTSAGDGYWAGERWEVTSWHLGSDNRQSRLRFVDRTSATPRYYDVALVDFGGGTSVTPHMSHADGVVWYENRLFVANGGTLDVVELRDLTRYSGISGFDYVLPVRARYTTTVGTSDGKCVPAAGTWPCMNGLSFDREHSALVSNEYYNVDGSGGRIVQWPFDLGTGYFPGTANTAEAAWVSPVWRMQGVVRAEGSFFISGQCPSSFDVSYREPACVHKGAPGDSTHVLTAVPDMAQNLDWDASTGRIRGVNEVAQADQAYPQRLVYDFYPTARPITTVRFRNVKSGKCLIPYGSSLNNGANVVQWDCNGKSGENWFWNGSEIRNFQSNRCLTVYGSSTANGAYAVQWECNGSTAQRWSGVTGAAGGGSLLVNGNSGLCLTIYGGGTSNGTVATQWTCDKTETAHSWIGYTP
ncbi:RICIN domain-containing protein [Streptomyces sp. Ru71]|uniref:RICIN domain-containing protein n=1 Tax=Streptomyces sp. Ru71 TaxID=2080746 RepID=UPI0011B0C01B|nr:RICIN domain-containing protein [Streptomyces sp. Ru71]